MSPAERARLKAAVDKRRRELELTRDERGRWKLPGRGLHRLRLAATTHPRRPPSSSN